ncbi:MAG: hypothetical protein Q9M28_05455 [Mariprofundaceae bacterium]|nr:hypothetical protein [Mariprofundaceae bacterium]
MRKIVWLFSVFWLFQGTAYAQNWYVKTDAQTIYGKYSKSAQRNDMVGAGLFVSADYLDHGGFTLGYNYTQVNLKAPLQSITQNDFTGNIRLNFHPDALPGVLTMRLDLHTINNDDASGLTDAVKAYGSQVSFLNYAKSLYVDVGYNYSKYQFNFNVNQITPTLGMGFNDASEWVQLRAYIIKLSDKKRAQGKSSTNALEVKWTHWFAVDNFLAADNLRASAMLGERIYAVDSDSASVYNLTDLQTGAYSLGLEWKLGDHTTFMMMGGLEKYENKTIQDKYESRFAYMNLGYQW